MHKQSSLPPTWAISPKVKKKKPKQKKIHEWKPPKLSSRTLDSPQSNTPQRSATIARKVHVALLELIAMCIVVS